MRDLKDEKYNVVEPNRPQSSAQKKIEHQSDHFNSVANEYFDSRTSRNHLLFKHHMWKYVFSQMSPYEKNEKSKV